MKGVIAALAVAVALVALPAAAGGATHVRIPSCGDKPDYKPRTVIMSCGDGAFRIVKLDWVKWGKKTAIGNGTAKILSCDPNCAEGKVKSYKVKLTAGKPVACSKGNRQFLRLTYTFPDRKPSGIARTNTVNRPCNSG
jgi:hypothetical protein